MATGFPIIFCPTLWTPALITTSLWLDASDTTTVTLNGTTVSQWNDKSGNQRNATQATSANQPIYDATGINGMPVMKFDGTNDFIKTGSWTLAPNRIFASFVVVNWVLSSAYQRLWISNTDYRNGYLGSSGSGGAEYLAIAGTNALGTTTVTAALGAGMVSNIFGTTEIGSNTNRVYWNGTAGGSLSGCTGSLSTTGVCVGSESGGSAYNGSVGEMIFVTSDLSVADRQKIEGYLMWKWKLQGGLPATHPYKNSPPYAP